jgi:hypothetical protein
LVYLNPSWTEGDGGELELVPFCGQVVTVRPLLDRMVLFYSDRILHRVLPAHAPRFCFTLWLDGTEVNGADDTVLRAKHLDGSLDDVIGRLQGSGLQRSLARGVYREAYQKSLEQCQGEAAPCMVESHSAQIAALTSSQAAADVIARLRLYNAVAATTTGQMYL